MFSWLFLCCVSSRNMFRVASCISSPAARCLLTAHCNANSRDTRAITARSYCKAALRNPISLSPGQLPWPSDRANMAILIVSFQVISLEGWVDIMYSIQDTHSFYDWVYFVLLIVVSNQSQPLLQWRQPSTVLGCVTGRPCPFELLMLIFFLSSSFLSGDKPRGLGQYYVLCSGHPFILGLDVFCLADRGKYAHWHRRARLTSNTTTPRVAGMSWLYK